MESKITIIRDNNGKVLGTKRQNPTTKPVIKKPLTNTTEMTSISNEEAKSVTTSPTLAEVKVKMASGQKLTIEENQVLLDNIKKTEAEYNIKRIQRLRTTQSAKTEFLPKTFPTASDQYLLRQEKIRQIEKNAAGPKSSGYKP